MDHAFRRTGVESGCSDRAFCHRSGARCILRRNIGIYKIKNKCGKAHRSGCRSWYPSSFCSSLKTMLFIIRQSEQISVYRPCRRFRKYFSEYRSCYLIMRRCRKSFASRFVRPIKCPIKYDVPNKAGGKGKFSFTARFRYPEDQITSEPQDIYMPRYFTYSSIDISCISSCFSVFSDTSSPRVNSNPACLTASRYSPTFSAAGPWLFKSLPQFL